MTKGPFTLINVQYAVIVVREGPRVIYIMARVKNRYGMERIGRLFAEHAGSQRTVNARGLREKRHALLLLVPGLRGFAEHKARIQVQAAVLQVAVRAFRGVRRLRSRGLVPGGLATDVQRSGVQV